MSQRQHQTQREYEKLLRVAREYRQKGYAVTVKPKPEILPPALANCAFDLIAHGEGKTIAVEVRSRETLTLNGSEDLSMMSRQVSQVPGWELELVVTNPRH